MFSYISKALLTSDSGEYFNDSGRQNRIVTVIIVIMANEFVCVPLEKEWTSD